MTPSQQKQFWLDFHRFQMRMEIRYTPRINRALKMQVQQYIANRDLVYVRSAGLYEVLQGLYKEVGAAWARRSRTELRQRKDANGQMGFSDRVLAYMRDYYGINLLNDAEGITQTTIRLIQQVLTDAALSGISFDEIVKQLTSPDFTATRARLIARTETVAAANGGAMVNGQIAGATKKIWIAARDNRTRPHHKEVNQTVIGIHEKFTVGSSLMDHPGDKAGSADEVCNCRCAVAFMK